MKINSLPICSIDDFILKWRWTDEKYCLMPKDDLLKISPLTKDASKTTFDAAMELIKSTKIETEGEKIDSSSDEESVKDFLQSKISDEKIIVNWSPDTSVITDAETFIKYWDEFCYPSSDDVSIYPEDESWLLQYFHFEAFSFVALQAY